MYSQSPRNRKVFKLADFVDDSLPFGKPYNPQPYWSVTEKRMILHNGQKLQTVTIPTNNLQVILPQNKLSNLPKPPNTPNTPNTSNTLIIPDPIPIQQKLKATSTQSNISSQKKRTKTIRDFDKFKKILDPDKYNIKNIISIHLTNIIEKYNAMLDDQEIIENYDFTKHLETSDFQVTDIDRGEVILLYGTNYNETKDIIRNGFNETIDEGISRGFYFTDNMDMADSYANKKLSIEGRSKVIIIVKVCLGDYSVVTNYLDGLTKPPCKIASCDSDSCDHERFDSVVTGIKQDGFIHSKFENYRTFVVNNPMRCIPIFAIRYKDV